MSREMNRVGRLIAIAAVGVACSAGCHKKEPGQTPGETPAAQSATPAAESALDIALDTSGPMKLGASHLDVTVRDKGAPVTDVAVSVELRMPPTAAMGEMRTGAVLEPAGDGHYRGEVDMTMAGQWTAIVRVRRGEEVVATRSVPVTVQSDAR